MAHSQETRDDVRRRYIEGLPLTGAVVGSGVSYDTAREWKKAAKRKGDDWDTARAAYRISDQGVDDLNKQLVEDFARQVITTTRELEESNLPAADKAMMLAQLADAVVAPSLTPESYNRGLSRAQRRRRCSSLSHPGKLQSRLASGKRSQVL